MARPGPTLPPVDELNRLPADRFASALAPLFEGAPRFCEWLAAARPFASDVELLSRAREIARTAPEEVRLELVNAHPRIGADRGRMSDLSRAEQGYEHAASPGVDDEAWVSEELSALNDAYERRFGFRFVVFVAGRPRSEIVPIIERSIHADRDDELNRAVDDCIHIAADRLQRLRGGEPTGTGG
jgi:2-oxo-4-hydroxy-4-carboxy--5-ureidoimidazoline (OHCU) decarboxylase